MREKNVVVIGGGEGTNLVLTGLKRYSSHLTVLVSTFDARSRQVGAQHPDGHSPQEVRSSLLALGSDAATTSIMEQLFAFHYDGADGTGDTFGNLLLSALAEITGGTDLALQAAARVLNVQGQVLPLTLRPGPLRAYLEDGTEAVAATSAELAEVAARVPIREVAPALPAPLLEAAARAIRQADILVLGPADLYFNVLAPLQLDGISQALAASSAVKIFVCGLLTQPGISTGWPASRFIRLVQSYMGGPGGLDCVIVNSGPLNAEALAEKEGSGAAPVVFDLEECLALGPNVIVRPLASATDLRHDPEKLARTILFLGGGRTVRRPDGRRPEEDADPTAAFTQPLLVPRGAES